MPAAIAQRQARCSPYRSPLHDTRTFIRFFKSMFPQAPDPWSCKSDHGGNRLSRADAEAFLGDIGSPPQAPYGIPAGKFQSLADILNWSISTEIQAGSKRVITANDVAECFVVVVGRKHEVDFKRLSGLGVYPHVWPLPLRLDGVREAQRLIEERRDRGEAAEPLETSVADALRDRSRNKRAAKRAAERAAKPRAPKRVAKSGAIATPSADADDDDAVAAGVVVPVAADAEVGAGEGVALGAAVAIGAGAVAVYGREGEGALGVMAPGAVAAGVASGEREVADADEGEVVDADEGVGGEEERGARVYVSVGDRLVDVRDVRDRTVLVSVAREVRDVVSAAAAECGEEVEERTLARGSKLPFAVTDDIEAASALVLMRRSVMNAA